MVVVAYGEVDTNKTELGPLTSDTGVGREVYNE